MTANTRAGIRLTPEQQALVVDHMAVVGATIAKLGVPDCHRDDCESEGMLALCEAARMQPCLRTAKFKTYAAQAIRNRVNAYLHGETKEHDEVPPLTDADPDALEAAQSSEWVPPTSTHCREALTQVLDAIEDEDERAALWFQSEGETISELAERMGFSSRADAYRLRESALRNARVAVKRLKLANPFEGR